MGEEDGEWMEEEGVEWMGKEGGEWMEEEGGEWMGREGGERMGEGGGEWAVSLALIKVGYPWQLALVWVVETSFPQGSPHLQYFQCITTVIEQLPRGQLSQDAMNSL